MKLTDEKVAKALGWRKCACDKTCKAWLAPRVKEANYRSPINPPPFTTSLDAIVAEIEARGLEWEWEFRERSDGKRGRIAIVGKKGGLDGNAISMHAYAPLALCAALLAYLKVNP